MNSVLAIILMYLVFTVSGEDRRKRYIVLLESLPEGDYSPLVHYANIIKAIVDPSFAGKSIQRSFGRSFHGFAAYLNKAEMQKLKRLPGVESVFLCQKLYPQTTRSMDYMHLSDGIARNPSVASDITIGVIDTGIWPESPSFKDDGFGPIPAKWKGECNGGSDFSCNKKIIGARYYSIDDFSSISARDRTGHGTHVASIVAGNYVKGANFYGIADGVAKGGVPSARLAVYKVFDVECHTTDLLSAFDDAIADGVDVISISIALKGVVDFTIDPIAIGSLHAIRRNILTSVAAGNEGPNLSSIQNYAPWMLTVEASTIDRKIMAKVLIGKETILVGQGVNAFPSSYRESPLVRGKEVTSTCSETDAWNCLPQCLESSLIKQKVVLCDMIPSFRDINITGVLGFVIPVYKKQNASVILPYNVVQLSENDLNLVKIYHSYNTDPEVQILKSEAVYSSDAPLVATFSGRGPSKFVPNIIKPDVTAPGVEILAAFSPKGSPSDTPIDIRSVDYNILSGTSMACPHVTAAAAYVKSFHPNWSPSAIKSALMTTAWKFDDGLHPEAEFAYGSGHINPLMATDPGLVYETPIEEYLNVWCKIYRTGSSTTTNASCPSESVAREINYPSMAALLDMQSFVVSFPRTVTNVGNTNSTYVAAIDGDLSDLHINVEPSTLQFTKFNQNLGFVVTIRGKRMKPATIRRVSLVWTDGVHKVRSPLVLYRMNAISRGDRAVTPRFCITLLVLIIMAHLY